MNSPGKNLKSVIPILSISTAFQRSCHCEEPFDFLRVDSVTKQSTDNRDCLAEFTLSMANVLAMTVAGIVASLERFLEFYSVILTKQGVSSEEMEKNWKLVSNQSERQLGAFFFIYLIENETSIHLSNKHVSFRNKVIHKAYIPTYQEVMNYGCLNPLIDWTEISIQNTNN